MLPMRERECMLYVYIAHWPHTYILVDMNGDAGSQMGIES